MLERIKLFGGLALIVLTIIVVMQNTASQIT